MKVGGSPPLQKLARLQVELGVAVKKEDFERAAKLRDRILVLKELLTKSPKRPKRQSEVA